ncbi:TolC family protein [Legionella pneumophila]|uniref:TolC family protein n=1 Tax=Legionella pneumophila TaxID=446 RepID=UPI001A2E80B2|nr:TolC family protein [Legionella pneumophila]HAT1860671.1 TolC family protein [Legionella pneumophila]
MRHFSIRKIIWIVLLSFCFTESFIYARPNPGLSQLIQEAKQNNPQIRAVRDRLLAAIHVIPQAKALPDPKLNAGYINMSENIPMDVDPRREQMLGGSQEIPFPGKLIVRGRIATLEAKRTQAEYQATCFAVIAELKRLYYDLYFVNKSIEIVQRNQELLHEMEQSAEATYSVGKTPQQDIYRAQTEISRLEMRLVILKQQRQSLQADINRLLNRSLERVVSTPATLPVTPMGHNLEYFYSLVKQRAPQLIMQRRNVQKGRQSIRLSKMEYFPDVEIEGGRLHDTGMHTKGYQVLLKATVPLYFMQKQNNAVRESIARYSADMEDLQTTYRALSFQVKNAYLLAERSAKLIHLIQHTIIPQATLTFTSSQANYGVGKVDFLTMLNNLLTLQENELEWHGELAEHEKAIAQIEETTGTYL